MFTINACRQNDETRRTFTVVNDTICRLGQGAYGGTMGYADAESAKRERLWPEPFSIAAEHSLLAIEPIWLLYQYRLRIPGVSIDVFSKGECARTPRLITQHVCKDASSAPENNHYNHLVAHPATSLPMLHIPIIQTL